MSSPAPGTVDDALRAARAVGMEGWDAQWLLANLLDRPRAWLLAHGDSVLTTEAQRGWQGLLRRHADGEPLAYLAGWTEFHGLRLRVSPDVLVPRSDTETLVAWALDVLAARPPGSSRPQVLDLGTGSGSIALAVKQAWPAADVIAVDASPAALNVARENGRQLRLEVQWLEGDWWAPLAEAAAFDLVLSNPPYIAEDDVHLAGLRHEPRSALTAGADGLDDLRRIVAGACRHLAPGSWLLLEHGWTQASQVATLLQHAGFAAITSRPDLAGRPRCTGGQRPELPAVDQPLAPTRLDTTR